MLFLQGALPAGWAPPCTEGSGWQRGVGERCRRVSQLPGWEGQRGHGTTWEAPTASRSAAELLGTRLSFSHSSSIIKSVSEIPGELGSVGSGGLCERGPGDTQHPDILSFQLGLRALKAASLSRHARGMAPALQSSCCSEEPGALPCETPGRNWVSPLKTCNYFTSFSPRWANPLLLWLCCSSVTNTL